MVASIFFLVTTGACANQSSVVFSPASPASIDVGDTRYSVTYASFAQPRDFPNQDLAPVPIGKRRIFIGVKSEDRSPSSAPRSKASSGQTTPTLRSLDGTGYTIEPRQIGFTTSTNATTDLYLTFIVNEGQTHFLLRWPAHANRDFEIQL
jgi:hypothetical protein